MKKNDAADLTWSQFSGPCAFSFCRFHFLPDGMFSFNTVKASASDRIAIRFTDNGKHFCIVKNGVRIRDSRWKKNGIRREEK